MWLIFGGLLIIAVGVFLFTSPAYVVSLGEKITTIVPATEEVVGPEKIYENGDIGPQKSLANPPETLKVVYATAWSAGSTRKFDYFEELFAKTEANAILIDVKDYTGVVSYRPDVPAVIEYDAWEERIPQINTLIKKFHDRGIYVIGRVAVFEDDKLARARPEWALHSSSTGELWTTNKDIAWMDTAARGVWDYNIAIAQDMINRGFDEVNFDYIRFPSDGKLSDIRYPVWDEVTYKRVILSDFFKYVREQMGTAKISADLFGEVTYASLSGVGQKLEDAFLYFDYIAPMVYPSHYAKGFIGYQNPANFPYEVVQYSMQTALDRLEKFVTREETFVGTDGVTSTRVVVDQDLVSKVAKFRPWFQDFDLGADYTASMIRKQVQAYDEIQFSGNSGLNAADFKNGWMMWAPSNVYTVGAFLPKE